MTRSWRSFASASSLYRTAQGLVQIDVPAIAKQLHDPLGVERNGQHCLDGIHLEVALGELADGGEGGGVPPVGLALLPASAVGVDQGHDLDVGVVAVGEDVEVVDGPEADKGDPERGRKGREGHRARSPSPARRVRGPNAPNAGAGARLLHAAPLLHGPPVPDPSGRALSATNAGRVATTDTLRPSSST